MPKPNLRSRPVTSSSNDSSGAVHSAISADSIEMSTNTPTDTPTSTPPATTCTSFDSLLQSSKFMKSIDRVVQAAVQQAMEKEMLRFVSNLEKRESRLSDMIEEKLGRLHDLEISVDTKIQEFRAVSESMEKMKDEINRVTREVNNLEQYSRRNNVRVLGMQESPNENTAQVICDLAKSIGVVLTANDIDRSHRVSRRPTATTGDQLAQGSQSYAEVSRSTETRPRAIIVKMTSYKLKEALLRNRRKLKGSGTVIVEDLTKRNSELLSTVSKMKDKVCAAWSTDGRIIALLKSTGKKKLITSLSDLRNI